MLPLSPAVGEGAGGEGNKASETATGISFDEVLTCQRVVSALARTLELQAQVDAVCKEAWGW